MYLWSELPPPTPPPPIPRRARNYVSYIQFSKKSRTLNVYLFWSLSSSCSGYIQFASWHKTQLYLTRTRISVIQCIFREKCGLKCRQSTVNKVSHVSRLRFTRYLITVCNLVYFYFFASFRVFFDGCTWEGMYLRSAKLNAWPSCHAQGYECYRRFNKAYFIALRFMLATINFH